MQRHVFSTAAMVLCALSAAGAAPAPSAITTQAVTTQLPRNVTPSHYALSITPDAAASRFDAHVDIAITVLSPTKTVTLNAADLRITRASVAPERDGAASARATIAQDADAQTATFTFADKLAPGRYRLALDYSGLIGRQAAGMFALDYDSGGTRQRALYTQFENSDARRVLPSWDEPGYKATFDLEAVVPAGQMAVSNMPAATSTALADGRKRVVFGRTPAMSTYVLFFALGDFERVTASGDGTEVGVITRRGGLPQAAFALDASKSVLREYNDYFGVRFPLPKLDNVAAPGRSQFFGAMENWGAIFTFEHTMLLDPATSSQTERQGVFLVAAHEIAHQWFGNLVTMRWWDDLWLNEGFASWMAARTTARLHPEWNTRLGLIKARESAMARDSLVTSHPVVQHVETVEQASQAFDDITYRKGQAVISMLEQYVGADAWREGVRAYMAAHAYGNTVSDDFWRAMEKAAARPILGIAHDFTLQPGVPLIRVDSARCEGGATVVHLSQSEFSRDQPQRKSRRWRVPVTLRLAGSAQQTRLLVENGAASASVPGCGALIVNAGQNGYYRTLYGHAQMPALAAQFARLAPIDQMGLLSDSWALGQAGLQPAADVLDLAARVPPDAGPQVWGKIASVLLEIDEHYKNSPARRRQFDREAVALLAPAMAQTGWNARDGESAATTVLRAQLIETLGKLDDAATIAEARRRFAARLSDPAALPARLRRAVLDVVARHADGATWNQLRAAAEAEKSPLLKDQLYSLVSVAEDDALARRALTLAVSDEPGATTGAEMLVQVAQSHPELAFDFAMSNLDKVDQRLDTTSRSRYYPKLAARSADPAMIGKLDAFASARLAPGSRRDVDTAIANIAERIKVRSSRLASIDSWLARHGS
ncbi:MAG: M1 family metallopeptidase [Massilia sp.]